jgi:hypothetical protein
MASLTVTYKKYNHFSEIPNTQIPKLKKLTKGKYGLMATLVQAYQQSYMWDEYLEGNWEYMKKWDEQNRYIAVAYVRNQPVGWCVTDDEGLFNVFVHREYRKLNIAQNLAYLWAQDNIPKVKTLLRGGSGRWYIVHTEDAEALIRAAANKLGITKTTRRKYSRVTHKLPDNV